MLWCKSQYGLKLDPHLVLKFCRNSSFKALYFMTGMSYIAFRKTWKKFNAYPF